MNERSIWLGLAVLALLGLVIGAIVGPRSGYGHDLAPLGDLPFRPVAVVHGEISRVIDGDTFDLNPSAVGYPQSDQPVMRIRFWGIDAPEMDTQAGKDAKAWAEENWLLDDVTCAIEKQDRYARFVAMCFRGRWNIAWEIIDAGHARDFERYSGGYYRRRPES